MYLWKINELKADLKSSLVSERDFFLYLFIPALLFAAAFEWALKMSPEDINDWDTIYCIGSIFIIFVGSILCFVGNGGNQGSDFLKRYISISFVMAVRLILWMLLLFIPIFIYYYYTITEDSDLASSAADTIPFLLLEALYYWRIYVHIQDVKDT